MGFVQRKLLFSLVLSVRDRCMSSIPSVAVPFLFVKVYCASVPGRRIDLSWQYSLWPLFVLTPPACLGYEKLNLWRRKTDPDVQNLNLTCGDTSNFSCWG